MLRLYLDDGGHEDNTEVMVVAGYLSRVEQWGALEPEWRAALVRGYRPIPYFHMSSCVAGRQQFEAWPLHARDALTRRLIKITNAHVEIAVARTVSLSDFRAIVIPNRSRFVRDAPTEHYASLTFALHTVLEYLAKEGLRAAGLPTRPTEQIAIAFEKGTKWLPEAIAYMAWLTSTATWGQVFGAIVPVPKTLPGAQAADILANEMYRHGVKQHADGGRPPANSDWVRRLKQAKVCSFKYADAESLREIVDSLGPRLWWEQPYIVRRP